MALVPFALSWLLGLFFVKLLWPWHNRTLTELLLQVFLAVAFGTGLTSSLLFVWLLVLGGPAGFVPSEIGVTIVLGLAVLLRRKRTRPNAPYGVTEPRFELGWLISSAFCLAVTAACAVLLVQAVRQPHGQYDAVSMWNAKARLIFLSHGDWSAAASSYLAHPDYPLLLPLSIARGWLYTGNHTTAVPALLASLFTLSATGLLTTAVTLLRGRTQGLLAGLVSLGPFAFLTWGASQYADIPFAFFMLATLVLLCLQQRAPTPAGALLLLAGMAAGFAAWTKNEGMLLVVAVSAVYALVNVRSKRPFERTTLYFLAGVIPALALVLLFKSQVAAANDIFAGQGLTVVARRMIDMWRYVLIAAALAKELLSFGEWRPNPLLLLAFYGAIVRFHVPEYDKAGVLIGAATLCLMLFGYLFIYVMTPRDLQWHLSTSLDRLLLHVWPSVVFLAFLILRVPSAAVSRQQEIEPQNVSARDQHYVV